MTAPGLVVVGAGHGGVQAAEAARLGGYGGTVTIVDEDPCIPYQRPPLSKDALAAGRPFELAPIRGGSWFVAQDISLRADRAVGVDRTSKELLLGSGERLPYASLVLATGSRHRQLPVPGHDLPGVFQLRDRHDALALREALPGMRSVVVVGGGFIGLEFAAVARAHGVRVVVLDGAPRLMARALSTTTALAVESMHARNGVGIHLDVSVESIVEAGGRAAGVVSTAGDVFDCDAVLVAVGAVAEISLAEAGGLEVDDGVVVDGFLRTADESVFAVGDCASVPVGPQGARRRFQSVHAAVEQARHVGTTVAQGPGSPFELTPHYWSSQGSIKLQIAGAASDTTTGVVLGDIGSAFSRLIFEDDLLTAVESVNQPAVHLAAKKVLASGRPTRWHDAREPDFSLQGLARSLVR